MTVTEGHGCAVRTTVWIVDNGGDLYEAEVRYLVEKEWAVTADDILWRRTKRGLHLGAEEKAALEKYLKESGGRRHTAAA